MAIAAKSNPSPLFTAPCQDFLPCFFGFSPAKSLDLFTNKPLSDYLGNTHTNLLNCFYHFATY